MSTSPHDDIDVEAPTTDAHTPRSVPARRPGRLAAALVALIVVASACDTSGGDTISGAGTDVARPIEFRDRTGPHVNDPDRSMAMTADAIDIVGDDILVRIRVENRDISYLDMGVQDTIYGPLLVMRDDRDNDYESYAVEPAGIPGRRVADLRFRLAGPLDSAAETFTFELATQRGPLVTPAGNLPDGDGVRWRIGGDEASPAYAAAPRLPDLVHFWLETDPLPAES